jgi:hypothetical protein
VNGLKKPASLSKLKLIANSKIYDQTPAPITRLSLRPENHNRLSLRPENHNRLSLRPENHNRLSLRPENHRFFIINITNNTASKESLETSKGHMLGDCISISLKSKEVKIVHIAQLMPQKDLE